VAPEDCALLLGPMPHLILYHYVVEEEEAFGLRSGDVVFFPRHAQHLLGSDLALPPVRAGDIIQPPKDGGLFSIHHGCGTRTSLVCGFLGCDSAQGNPVIATLPAALRLTIAEGGAAAWMRSTFQYAAPPRAATSRPCCSSSCSSRRAATGSGAENRV
jgi:hypothetical protein